eukprot:7217775-Heterocapsa_arctica.AAC.1
MLMTGTSIIADVTTKDRGLARSNTAFALKWFGELLTLPNIYLNIIFGLKGVQASSLNSTKSKIAPAPSMEADWSMEN